MTREEQMIMAATDYGYEVAGGSLERVGISQAFAEGAKWADKTMIESIENFLYTNFYDHPHEKNFVCSEEFKDLEDMVEMYHKTLEEQ